MGILSVLSLIFFFRSKKELSFIFGISAYLILKSVTAPFSMIDNKIITMIFSYFIDIAIIVFVVYKAMKEKNIGQYYKKQIAIVSSATVAVVLITIIIGKNVIDNDYWLYSQIINAGNSFGKYVQIVAVHKWDFGYYALGTMFQFSQDVVTYFIGKILVFIIVFSLIQVILKKLSIANKRWYVIVPTLYFAYELIAVVMWVKFSLPAFDWVFFTTMFNRGYMGSALLAIPVILYIFSDDNDALLISVLCASFFSSSIIIISLPILFVKVFTIDMRKRDFLLVLPLIMYFDWKFIILFAGGYAISKLLSYKNHQLRRHYKKIAYSFYGINISLMALTLLVTEDKLGFGYLHDYAIAPYALWQSPVLFPIFVLILFMHYYLIKFQMWKFQILFIMINPVTLFVLYKVEYVVSHRALNLILMPDKNSILSISAALCALPVVIAQVRKKLRNNKKESQNKI